MSITNFKINKTFNHNSFWTQDLECLEKQFTQQQNVRLQWNLVTFQKSSPDR